MAVCLLTLTGSAFAKNSFDAQQKQQIGEIVREYLLNNPQVLVEVSQKLQEQQQDHLKQMEQKAQALIPEIADDLFNAEYSPAIGNTKGNVTVVEFFDYQCPHCKNMSEVIEGVIKADSNVKIVFKEFPIFGRSSVFASKAALASQKQGKYKAFHDALMNASNPLTEEKVLKAAKSVGLNIKKLKTDMESAQVKNEITANVKLAQKLGLMGTPAFVIGSTENTKDSKSFFVPGGTSTEVLQGFVSQVRGEGQANNS